MESCSPGSSRVLVELARDRAIERLDQEGDLAAARDSGHAGEQAERNIDGDVFQIVGARARSRRGACP